MTAQSHAKRWMPSLLMAFAIVAVLMASAPPAAAAQSEDGYSGSDMWLRYVPVSDAELLERYRSSVTTVIVENAGRNAVYRHTDDLRMAPGSNEKLVRDEPGGGEGRARTGSRRAAGPRSAGEHRAGQQHPRRRRDRRNP